MLQSTGRNLEESESEGEESLENENEEVDEIEISDDMLK
jgi:hypothetical protein